MNLSLCNGVLSNSSALKLFVSVLLSTGVASAASFTLSDFSDVSALTLNGAAAQVGTALRVVPNTMSLAGTAFWTAPILFDVNTAFSTSFKFNITTDAGNPTDGFTFLLQSQGINAVGQVGQGSGYAGLSPSVAVLFRGRSPAFIGVIENGVDPLPSEPAGATTHVENDFYNQNEFAWIDYNPLTTQLSVFLGTSATKPGVADMITTVDIASIVGSSAYVGFSAGTGGGYGDNDILNWSFDSNKVSASVPDAGSGTVLIAFAALALFGRACKRQKSSR